MAAYAKPYRFTPQEYLDWERQQETKHQYLDGDIVAMAGASPPHTMIQWDMSIEIGVQLKGSQCQAFSNDMRILVPACNRYYYADIPIACGEPDFEDRYGDTLTNPTVLIEILSPSTEQMDRGEKLLCYQTLPSLQLYVLVAQNEPRVEIYRRHGNEWRYTVTRGLDATVVLEPIGVTLRLADIYARVTFEDSTQGDTAT
jgi:Uma2 family endonuclease